ncbi:hypothetical protein FRC07_001163, partial [Ceratobasidium sp. 392]
MPVCDYCGLRLETSKGYSNHIVSSERCAARHRGRIASAYSTDDGSDGEQHEEDEIVLSDPGNQSDRSGEGKDRVTNDEDMRADADFDRMSVDDGDAEQVPPRLRGTETFVEPYPFPTVGTPIQRATAEELNEQRRSQVEVGPFADKELFELVEILMTSGMSGNQRDKFLKLNRMNDGTPWSNNREMILDIDKFLPRGPKWRVKTFEVVGNKGVEHADFWFREGLEAILHLLADPQFKDQLLYQPTKEWTDPECTTRKYGKTTCSNRMWSIQNAIQDKHATVIPTYVASDETALTVFVRKQKAHPVYLTIGNIPKDVRCQTSKRGMILVGYLPVVKLECESNIEKRRILKRKLFHECQHALMESLREAGKQGVEAVCSDGGVRRIHPVYCGGMLDFAEQCRYACICQTVCPTCEVPAKERGDLTNYPGRDLQEILAAMEEHEADGSARFVDLGLIPVRPFWADLPFVDASPLFPPDLLHQMYKGVFKDHLLEWSAHAVGKVELNNRFKSMSPYHSLRHFKDGVMKAARWTGRELKEQSRAYLPTIVGEEPEVTACARALTNFMFLAHSSSLTDDDLAEMESCLEQFHENKQIFPEIGALGEQDPAKKKSPVHTFHGIPKIHAIQHYTFHIREHGTPNSFNTELPERLHIPNAKEGYQRSNKKDAIKQMATHIQRMEALAMHRAYLNHAAHPDAEYPEL